MSFWYVTVLSMSMWISGGAAQIEPFEVMAFVDNPFMSEVGVTIGYGPVYAGATILTGMYSSRSLLNYSPFDNTYVIRGGINLGFLDIGIEHECWHPMVAYQWLPSRSQVVPSYEGAGTRVYARIELGGRP